MGLQYAALSRFPNQLPNLQRDVRHRAMCGRVLVDGQMRMRVEK